jgi:hypothetical protein
VGLGKSTGFTFERKAPDKNQPGNYAEVIHAAAIEADRDPVAYLIIGWI